MDLRRENFAGLGAALKADRRRILGAGGLLLAGALAFLFIAWPQIDDDTHLEITYLDEPGAEPQTWEVDCDGPQQPERIARACSLLEHANRQLLKSAAVPGPCPMIAGGPQTARVHGEIHGDNVDVTFSRQGGCELMRWNEVLPLLESSPQGLPESARELDPGS